jgi:sensor histidine kinase YesM
MVRQKWLIGIAVVVFVVILETIPQILSGRSHMGTRTAYRVVETSLVVVALSVYHRWATRRRMGTVRMLAVSLAISAAVGAICGLVLAFVTSVTSLTISNAPRSMSSWRTAIAFGIVLGLVQCGVWALGFIYPSAIEDARLRALEAEKLKLEAEKLRGAAELARLRSQLEPHFLLNTLNAIAGLVTQRPKEARRLLACLGDLLRDSLRDPDEMQTLEEEVEWLRRYAEILESRHSGVLLFRWEIADETRTALLPRLLLQPLVENAVKHGALHAGAGGEVVVRSFLDGNALVCTVEDNGPGISDAEPRSGAFGLRSVRRRLELKFAAASLSFEARDGGTRSVVRMPHIVEREALLMAEVS